MLHSCTHMATVGVKGLNVFELLVWFYVDRCICQSVNCVEWWVNGLRPRVAFPSCILLLLLYFLVSVSGIVFPTSFDSFLECWNVALKVFIKMLMFINTVRPTVAALCSCYLQYCDCWYCLLQRTSSCKQKSHCEISFQTRHAQLVMNMKHLIHRVHTGDKIDFDTVNFVEVDFIAAAGDKVDRIVILDADKINQIERVPLFDKIERTLDFVAMFNLVDFVASVYIHGLTV